MSAADLPENTGGCDVCGEPVPTHDLVGHLRVMHPDVYEPMETWPDGGPVVTYEDPRPEFITGEES